MAEFGAFLLICWLIFIIGGTGIIVTYIIWQTLKAIVRGDFL